MKTPEEIGQEILLVVAAKPTWGSADLFKFEHLITQALIAYAEERVSEALNNIPKNLLFARNEALELAAKLYESGCLPKCNSYGHEALCPYVYTAEAIRALKIQS